MLRRISTIIAAAAMLILSALPVSAATLSSSTHKLSFPGLHGVAAWGSYTKTGTKIRVSVCAGVTAHGIFADGAVVMDSNANYSKQTKFGAVAIGYHQASCVSQNLRYTSHLRIYTFVGGSNGKIAVESKTKTVY
jgi:hypothetical protein